MSNTNNNVSGQPLNRAQTIDAVIKGLSRRRVSDKRNYLVQVGTLKV